MEGTRRFCQGVQWHDAARTEDVCVSRLPLLSVSRDVSPALFEQADVFRTVVGYPAAALKVGVEDANEEDILGGVLEELFGQGSSQPHVAASILVH